MVKAPVLCQQGPSLRRSPAALESPIYAGLFVCVCSDHSDNTNAVSVLCSCTAGGTGDKNGRCEVHGGVQETRRDGDGTESSRTAGTGPTGSSRPTAVCSYYITILTVQATSMRRCRSRSCVFFFFAGRSALPPL